MSAKIHHIPGRLRLRSALTRNHPGRAEALEKEFRAIDGVLSTLVSPRTGSLTIVYDPERLEVEDLYRVVDRIGTPPQGGREVSTKRATKVTKAGEMFGKAAFDVFVAKALERSLVSLLAALR